MIYSKNNPPIKCIMKNSTCYKGTTTFVPKGVLWHSTGANNPKVSRYVQPLETDNNYDEMISLLGKNKNRNDWNHITRKAGVNAWIGKLADGTVATVQTLEWNQKPWGCGSGSKGSCNSTHVQFEICEDGLSNKDYFNKVYKEACELTAYICEMYNLDPMGYTTLNGVKVPVILCHQDSYKLGLGSNHGDIYHWFKKHGKDMDDVRNDVAALMKKPNNTNTASPAEPKPNTTTVALKYKKGDIVYFSGGKHYASANAAKGSDCKASKAKITAVSAKGLHPYHCRAIDEKGKFVSGLYGWVDASSISANAPVETKPVAKPVVKPDVIYQAYVDGKWLSEIKNYNNTNTKGYAGILGKEISGLRVKLSNGKTITIRSHISGKPKSIWLSEIAKWDNTSKGYSGIKGKGIDCVSMKADGYKIKYRVHVKGGEWLSWISKYDIGDSKNGVAGIYGKPIDAIQIAVE